MKTFLSPIRGVYRPAIGTVTSSGTPTPSSESVSHYTITALAANATFGVPAGTPTDGQRLLVRILDDGTTRTLSWNAIYRAVGVTLPTATTVNKTLYVGMMYNSASSTWDVLAVGLE